MNVKRLIVATTLLVTAASAFAGDINPFGDEKPFVSVKTRTEVQTEYFQARANGLIPRNVNTNYPPALLLQSSRTREAVRAEAVSSVAHRKFNRDYDIS